VIDVVLLATGVALVELTAEGWSATIDQVGQDPPVTGQEVGPEAMEIIRAVATEDVSDFRHGVTTTGLQVRHQLVDGDLDVD
jgi:hypothetical protein